MPRRKNFLKVAGLSVVLFVFFSTAASAGFLYNINILSRDEVRKLTDDQLTEIYINAKIEERASSEFHGRAGFSSAEDYNKRKALLRFIFELRREMSARQGLNASELDTFLE